MFGADIDRAAGHAEHVRQLASSGAPGRSALAASWRRSLMHHALDPAAGARPEPLEATGLRARREASALLLRVAAPLMDRLAAAALDAGGAVMLGDAGGLVLDERLRGADDADFSACGLRSGTIWSEAAEGTNGIGTCLAERRPVVIWRGQHFHSRNIDLTCMSAPIEAPDGGLAGVLDISSCRDDLTEAQARLIALSVQDTATRIGLELFREAHPGARIIAFEGEVAYGPCLLAVDADDLVMGANRAGRRALGLDDRSIASRLPAADLLREGPARGDLASALRSEMTRVLQRHGGNVTAAARELRIGRATLYRKMKTLGLDPARRS